MVFCCIAIVGMAVAYWSFLSARQLIIGLRRDKTSDLPVPPRALLGNGAQPVFGHTWIFRRLGGDLALDFSPDCREWKWTPGWCGFSRKLGDCFAIFIWGQWRVVIRGPERVRTVMDLGCLKEDWAWSPPAALLGNKCMPLMEDDAADFLYQMLSKPLSHESIIDMAPDFADLAEKFMKDLIHGNFRSPREKRRDVLQVQGDNNAESEGSSASGSFSFEQMEEGRSGSEDSADDNHKIKYEALRSFTFDLIDGPILRTNRWKFQSDDQTNEESSSQEQYGRPHFEEDNSNAQQNKNKPLGRQAMMLWMDRLKRSMCSIKMTFGAEWTYIWVLNDYGRAVNGRMHIQQVLNDHVEQCSKALPIRRKPGYTFKDPFSMAFPIVTMAENLFYSNETATGKPDPQIAVLPTRKRTHSEPNLDSSNHASCTCETDKSLPEDSGPAHDLQRKPLSKSVDFEEPSSDSMERHHGPPRRERASTCPEVFITPPLPPERMRTNETSRFDSEELEEEKARVPSLLDRLLRRIDGSGDGLTSAAVTESSILLWMMMDAGNAWTAMALNLLALDESACVRVQQELDGLISLHGREDLFTPKVMSKMKVLDGLLYEAIRLCPPFLGGLKRTTKTIELIDEGLQIPKNTALFFCQPTEGGFDLSKAIGKKPQDLGKRPSPELHGFLPFKGLEVPLMVLQSKIFVAVLLQKFSPFLSKKRTFIRKLKTAVLTKTRHTDESSSLKHVHNTKHEEVSSVYAESAGSLEDARHVIPDAVQSKRHGETTQSEAMKLFDKIPFPEPRRVLNVRERHSALEILGVARLGH